MHTTEEDAAWQSRDSRTALTNLNGPTAPRELDAAGCARALSVTGGPEQGGAPGAQITAMHSPPAENILASQHPAPSSFNSRWNPCTWNF